MARESIAALRRRIAELKGAGRELSAQEIDEIPTLYKRIGEIGAARRTAYERGRVPLFADQIPETEAIDYQAAEERDRQRKAAFERGARRQAVVFRRRLRMLLPEEYPALRARWNSFQGPHTPSYCAGYWRTAFRENIGIDPDGHAMPSKLHRIDPKELDYKKNGVFQS